MNPSSALKSSRLLLIAILFGFRILEVHAAPFDPFLEKHCYSCHDAQSKEAGLDLATLTRDLRSTADRERWVRAYDRVAAAEMPPKEMDPPDAQEKSAFLQSLGSELLSRDAEQKGTALRRLNRIEYENSLRDLLGVHVHVKDLLPEDSLALGFDTNGEALGISSVQMRRYLEAAESALAQAIPGSPKPTSKQATFSCADSDKPGVPADAVGKTLLLRPDGAIVKFDSSPAPGPSLTVRLFAAPMDGNYRARIRAYAYQSSGPIVFGVYTGTKNAEVAHSFHSAPPTPDQPFEIQLDLWLRKGDTLKFQPPSDFPFIAKTNKLTNLSDYSGLGLAILPVEIEGPIIEQWPSPGQRLLFGALMSQPATTTAKSAAKAPATATPAYAFVSRQPSEDAKKLLPGFLKAAFRRNQLPQETIDRYIDFFEAQMRNGESFDQAMRSTAVAALCSADFLFLRELPGQLDDEALAARLAFFLTRSPPDAELMELAKQKRLVRSDVLRQQTERLLESPRCQDFIQDFTDGWLKLRDIDATTPDGRLYPEFDASLKFYMLAESRAFFGELLHSNLPITHVVKSDFAMLNDRLARHYGVAGITGAEIRKVQLPKDSKRGGFLTQAAILKVSANGTSTSPVLRGVFVQRHVLGFEPPAPPPGVPGLEPDIRGAKTIREQLDKHRNLDQCRDCHAIIDPPGFALENYDVIGQWRERYRIGDGDTKPLAPWDRRKHWLDGPAVDASGRMSTGEPFDGFNAFATWVVDTQQEALSRNLLEKLLTFATGRAPTFSDREEIKQISQSTPRARDLLHAAIQSSIFRRK